MKHQPPAPPPPAATKKCWRGRRKKQKEKKHHLTVHRCCWMLIAQQVVAQAIPRPAACCSSWWRWCWLLYLALEMKHIWLARWWPVTVQNFWCPCYVQVFQLDKISSGGSICQEHNSICLGIAIATTCGGLDSNFFFQKQRTREEVSRTKALSWKKDRQTLEQWSIPMLGIQLKTGGQPAGCGGGFPKVIWGWDWEHFFEKQHWNLWLQNQEWILSYLDPPTR